MNIRQSYYLHELCWGNVILNSSISDNRKFKIKLQQFYEKKQVLLATQQMVLLINWKEQNITIHFNRGSDDIM